MIRWWRRRRQARAAQRAALQSVAGSALPSFVRLAPGAGDFHVTVRAASGPMVRPVEFGPLLQPLDVVERIRTAVFRDQMKALAGRFAQQAEAFQDEFVERWGLHWTYDYVEWMTA